MRINKIFLENFESHVNTVIEFDPYFNCIVGPTNVGKTAIFNAILFALFNEWDPDFLRYGTTQCKVILEFDSFKIERVKGTDVNCVIIEKDGKQYKFENFGKEYPEEVKKLIGVKSIEDWSSCFAFQDNSSFLIYDSSVAKASVLNKITYVDLLEEAIKKVQTEIKNVEDEISSLEAKKKELLEESKKLDLIDKVEKLYEKLGNYEAKKEDYKSKITELLSLKDNILNIDHKIKNLSFFESLPSSEELDEWINLCNVFLEIFPIYTRLEEIDSSLSKAVSELNRLDVQLGQKVSDLTEILSKDKKCPLCGSPLTSDSVNYIFKDVL